MDAYLKIFEENKGVELINEACESGIKKLASLGYIQFVKPNNGICYASVTDSGKRFMASRGFLKQAEDDTFERNIKEDTLREAKRANIIAYWAFGVSILAILGFDLPKFFKFLFELVSK